MVYTHDYNLDLSFFLFFFLFFFRFFSFCVCGLVEVHVNQHARENCSLLASHWVVGRTFCSRISHLVTKNYKRIFWLKHISFWKRKSTTNLQSSCVNYLIVAHCRFHLVHFNALPLNYYHHHHHHHK